MTVCSNEHDMEYLASITGRERLDYISDCPTLTKGSGLCSYRFLLFRTYQVGKTS